METVSTGWRYLAALVVAMVLVSSCHSPVRRARGGLAEASFVRLGGLEQWVTIRGASGHKPLLLLVHGGPGDVQSSFVEDYAPYEQDFILVQWDQRGAGRTYGKYGEQTPDLTLERVVQDGIELAQHLHRRFPRNELILLGHSWGTAIATEMVRRRPDLFAAYVGTGQIASWSESVQWQFNFLQRQARETNDQAMLASLQAIGMPDPSNARQYFEFSRPIRRFLGLADARWMAKLISFAQSPGRQSDPEFQAAVGGMDFSAKALLSAQMNERLSSEALSFALPYIVIQGQQDLFTPTEPVIGYFDKITAPNKKLIILPDAGHFALVSHAAQFSAALTSALQASRTVPRDINVEVQR